MTLSRIGRYTVLAEIGHGGMATVYRAHDPAIGRDVAIKMMAQQLMDTPHLRDRFQREVRIIATLEHPAIVPVYDFGEQDRQPYLVMRYMPGASLRERLAGGPLSLAAALSILQRIADALDFAHRRGVIHRDLKPGNLLFDHSGDAFLADFGIATMMESTTALTGQSVIGTPAYMSPEQLQGLTVDGRSDIYSLGVILFEMLTGRQPYQATSPIAIAFQHVHDPVPDLLALQPGLPAACRPVISKLLAKEPAARFATAMAAVEALRELSPGIRVSLPVRVQQRLLDVAIAKQVLVGWATELVAMVRQTESEGLVAVLQMDELYSAEPEEVVSRPFRIEFPVDVQGGLQASELIMKVRAPDFQPRADEKQIRVPPEGDSEPVIFLFTPQKAGPLVLTVELYSAESHVASRLLRTQGAWSPEDIESEAQQLVTIPLNLLSYWPDAAFQTQLRQLLVRHFNLEELRDLCFELDVNFDDLDGRTLSGRARELVLLMLRQNRLPELVAAMEQNRPRMELFEPEAMPEKDMSSWPTQVMEAPRSAGEPTDRKVTMSSWLKVSMAILVGIALVTAGVFSPVLPRILGFSTPVVVSVLTATPTPPREGTAPTSETPLVAVEETATPTPTPIRAATATYTPPPPAGDRLLFQSNRDGDFEIYSVLVDGSGLRQLTQNRANDRLPAVSPDGERVAFESFRDGNWELYVMNKDGSGQRNVTLHPDNDRLPSWSPDGRRLVFISDRDGDYDLYLLDVDAVGDELVQVTDSELREGHVSWSVNDRLVYNAGQVDGRTWEIYTSELDGGDRQRLTNNEFSDWSPEWSPDGERILFLSIIGDNDPAIYIMEADGSQRRLLYNSPDYEWGARWSSDGQEIAFTVERGSFSFLHLMDADGGNVRDLAIRGSYPAWSK